MTGEISEMQKQMYAAVGHDVEIHIVGGYKTFTGKCINYMQPLDNEPEVASIDIDTGMVTSVTELLENEIDSIKILDHGVRE